MAISLSTVNMPSDAYGITFTKVLNDYGSASFKVKRLNYSKGKCYNSDETTLLGSTGTCAFYIELFDNEVFAFVYEDESFEYKDGMYEITYSGAGVMSILDHAKLWPRSEMTQLDIGTCKFQYGDQTYTVIIGVDGGFATKGIYVKSFGKSVDGVLQYTNPRLIGSTLNDLVSTYNTETANRNTNNITLNLSSSLGSANIGAYQKEIGSSYGDIFVKDIAQQLGMFIRDEYNTGIKISMYANTELTKLVTISETTDLQKIEGISGNYSSKENYQCYLTLSNDVCVSCRDGNNDGREGILNIADFADPNIHSAYSRMFINKNSGNIILDYALDGTGIEPFSSFDVGDLLTVGTGALINNNRVNSITVNIDENNGITAQVEVNANDKADSLINLPKLIKEELLIRETALKNSLPGNSDVVGISIKGNNYVFNMSNSMDKDITINTDSDGNITGIVDNKKGTTIPVTKS